MDITEEDWRGTWKMKKIPSKSGETLNFVTQISRGYSKFLLY